MTRIMTRILLALAVIGMAAGVGLSQADVAHASETPPSEPSENIVAVLYADSTNPTSGTSGTYWSDVESANSGGDGEDHVKYAVVNICAADGSGSGDCTGAPDDDPPSPQMDEHNTNWDSTICALESAGITPLYYISTDYDPGTFPFVFTGTGTISPNTITIEQEMSLAETWYTTDNTDCASTATPIGFMFDETSSSAANAADYQGLYTYATDSTAGGGLGAPLVMFNPGDSSVPDNYVFGPDEILNVFEGTEAQWQADANPATCTESGNYCLPTYLTGEGYVPSQFSAVIYAGSANLAGSDVNWAGQDGIGNVYVSSGSSGNVYATLPSFWNLSAGTVPVSDEVWDAAHPDSWVEEELNPATNGYSNGYGLDGGYCMTPAGVTVGSKLELEACNATTGQSIESYEAQFEIGSGPWEGDYGFEIWDPNSGLCVTLVGAQGHADGVEPEMGECAGASTQIFTLVPNSHGDYSYVSAYVTDNNGKYIAIDDPHNVLTVGTLLDSSAVTSDTDDTWPQHDWDMQCGNYSCGI